MARPERQTMYTHLRHLAAVVAIVLLAAGGTASGALLTASDAVAAPHHCSTQKHLPLCDDDPLPVSPLTHYELVASHSGKCLDVAYMSTADLADVIQATCW